jgi:hypothetical protein
MGQRGDSKCHRTMRDPRTRMSQMALLAGGAQFSRETENMPQRRITYLDEQMYVIRHEAVGVKSRREAFDDLFCKLVEECLISRRKEDLLSMITAHRHVIERAGYVQTEGRGIQRLSCDQAATQDASKERRSERDY